MEIKRVNQIFVLVLIIVVLVQSIFSGNLSAKKMTRRVNKALKTHPQVEQLHQLRC